MCATAVSVRLNTGYDLGSKCLLLYNEEVRLLDFIHRENTTNHKVL